MICLLRTRLRPLALVVGIGWALTSAGCYSWRAAPVFENGAATEHMVDLRLTLPDSTRIYLFDARIVGDSLVGTTINRGGTRVPASVAVAQVRAVEVRQVDGGRTVVLVAVVAVALGAAAAALSNGMSHLLSGAGP